LIAPFILENNKAREFPGPFSCAAAKAGQSTLGGTMASDDRKIRTKPAPKNDTLPTNQSTPDAAPSKAEGAEKDVDLSSGYNRGEGQKPVSKAYKENWNLIFAKKRKR
jgi:hypothetical protein